MNLNDLPVRIASIEAEQAVLGALLLDNDAMDRIPDVKRDHFYRNEHREIFAEITRQIGAGKTCDVISLFEVMNGQMVDCLPYLNSLAQNTPSSAGIRRHADTIIDRALKRSIVALAADMHDLAMSSADDSYSLLDTIGAKIDDIAQRKTSSVPVLLSESLSNYVDTLTARMAGLIKPICTSFVDLDRRLDGGFERGTLTVVAGRPGTGKSAFGLALCRNVAEWGSAVFLSMEMPKDQVHDRNIAALGSLPITWLRKPAENDKENWDKLTHAFRRSTELAFRIDYQTGLNAMEIRSKARSIKRRNGLDLLVIDQLSFITGGSKDKKTYEVVGEYTRGLIALAKELDVAVVLLCQLNRECETRPNKRPQMSDLASSGSIEQDAANILFLYRDELYNPDTMDRGVCEVNIAKQRQGEPGTVPLTYIAAQTRFEDYTAQWQPPKLRAQAKSKGLD